MSALQASAQLAPLPVWERFFFDGDRLRAEVSLFGAAFVGDLQSSELAAGCAQILRSHGISLDHEPRNAFAAFQERQPEPLTSYGGLAAVSSCCRSA